MTVIGRLSKSTSDHLRVSTSSLLQPVSASVRNENTQLAPERENRSSRVGWKDGGSSLPALWATASAGVQPRATSFLAKSSQSGPRRQGFADAAKNAPLTAPGRSEYRSAKKEERRGKLYLTWPSHGRRFHQLFRNLHTRRTKNGVGASRRQ